MKASQAARDLIRSFEGCQLRAYLCPAGVPTIGVGHTKGVKMGDTCTLAQADQWLSEDLEVAESAIASLVKVPLTQAQFDALASFIFNLGVGAFGRSTMLILLNKGKYVEAANQFPLWVHAGGQRLGGLVRRRAAESALFRSGMREAA